MLLLFSLSVSNQTAYLDSLANGRHKIEPYRNPLLAEKVTPDLSYLHPNFTPDLSDLHPNFTPDLSYLHPNFTPDLSYLHPNFTPDLSYLNPNSTPDLSQLKLNFIRTSPRTCHNLTRTVPWRPLGILFFPAGITLRYLRILAWRTWTTRCLAGITQVNYFWFTYEISMS